MLFGDKKAFAVETELSREQINYFAYGKFCYWIDGIQVGDYEFDTILNDVVLDLDTVRSYCGKRPGGKLCHLSFTELYKLIKQSLSADNFFEKSKGDYLEVLNDSIRYRITLPIDIMIDWEGFLIECSENEIIVFKHVNEVSVNSILLPHGTFCKIVNEAGNYLETLFEGVAH